MSSAGKIATCASPARENSNGCHARESTREQSHDWSINNSIFLWLIRSILIESPFNMTREGDEDIEGGSENFKTFEWGALKKIGGGAPKICIFQNQQDGGGGSKKNWTASKGGLPKFQASSFNIFIPPPPPPCHNRELKHQTFSTGRRQPEVQFTSDPRFPPTGSTVATSRRLCFAYFDVACKTWVSLLWFSCFYIILPAIFCTQWYVKYYSIVLAFLRAIVKYLKSFFQLFSL